MTLDATAELVPATAADWRTLAVLPADQAAELPRRAGKTRRTVAAGAGLGEPTRDALGNERTEDR